MLEAGFQLGHYRILRPLGSGGMADVYEAEDGKLGRHVALKILPPELSRNPDLIARFETEVRAAALLNHRNIVTVFEVGHQDHYHYYSMRLLPGGDLRARIEQGMSAAEAVAILRELAEAFAHAHGKGFVHRDVKPANIMFDEQGLPVLTDFGIAKALGRDSNVTVTGTAIGTPRYISPEQARGRPVDARADLYSLGVVFYEMLTGRPPFEAEESLALVLMHVSEPIPRLPAPLAPLQALVDALMSKLPEQRPATAVALLQLIDALPPQALQSQLNATPSTAPAAESAVLKKFRSTAPLRTVTTSVPAEPWRDLRNPVAPAPQAATPASSSAAPRWRTPVFAALGLALLGAGAIAGLQLLGPAAPVAQTISEPLEISVPPPAAPAQTEESVIAPPPVERRPSAPAAADAKSTPPAPPVVREDPATRREAEAHRQRTAAEEAARSEAGLEAQQRRDEELAREQARKDELRRQEEQRRRAAAEEEDARRREEERRRKLEQDLEEEMDDFGKQ